MSNDYAMVFKDDTNGTFMGHGPSNTDQYPADGSMDQNLRWFIENGRAGYINNKESSTGGGASEFTTLTDTPSAFEAGSYLRVNAAGDAVEQVKTAPPDGGAGDHSLIQADSNFASKLPDAILVTNTSASIYQSVLYAVTDTSIQYTSWTQSGSPYYVTFNNDSTGTGGHSRGSNMRFLNSDGTPTATSNGVGVLSLIHI